MTGVLHLYQPVRLLLLIRATHTDSIPTFQSYVVLEGGLRLFPRGRGSCLGGMLVLIPLTRSRAPCCPVLSSAPRAPSPSRLVTLETVVLARDLTQTRERAGSPPASRALGIPPAIRAWPRPSPSETPRGQIRGVMGEDHVPPVGRLVPRALSPVGPSPACRPRPVGRRTVCILLRLPVGEALSSLGARFPPLGLLVRDRAPTS